VAVSDAGAEIGVGVASMTVLTAPAFCYRRCSGIINDGCPHCVRPFTHCHSAEVSLSQCSKAALICDAADGMNTGRVLPLRRSGRRMCLSRNHPLLVALKQFLHQGAPDQQFIAPAKIKPGYHYPCQWRRQRGRYRKPARWKAVMTRDIRQTIDWQYSAGISGSNQMRMFCGVSNESSNSCGITANRRVIKCHHVQPDLRGQ